MSEAPYMPGRDPATHTDSPAYATPPPPPRRRRVAAFVLGAATALIIIGFVGWVAYNRGASQGADTSRVEAANPVPAEPAPPAPSPTQTVEPTSVGRFGQAVKLDTLTVTVYRYKPLREEPIDGNHLGAVDIKVCNTDKVAFSVGGPPWSLIFADDTVSQKQWTGYLSPEYPINGRNVNPGRCVRGWITFELSGKQKPAALEYAPGAAEEGLPTVVWKIG